MLKTRLESARDKYVNEYITLFTENDGLDLDEIFKKQEVIFNTFLQELLKDEDDTANQILKGGWFGEIDFFMPIFNHFKSFKIYDAIKANCFKVLYSDIDSESVENLEKRKSILFSIEKQLGI